MSYLVLARRFRPQTFSSIVGQEHISEALANSILRGRVPHALLLTGPRGVGKTTTARVFAKAVNCTGRAALEELQKLDPAEGRKQVEPCGECANCKEISRSSNLAVREIDGASNNSVENVRELIESLRSLPPPGSRYKIYIIDEVHMLSTAAFNALLKSLEEPPPNTIFIFATTDPQKIPETVISRCQRYDFQRLSSALVIEKMREIAQAEKVEIDDRVLEMIARKANGGMRDAQSMLDRLFAFSLERIDLALAQRVFGVVDRETFDRLAAGVFQQVPEQCFEIIDGVFQQSIDLRSFAADFLSYWRSLLLVRLSLGSAERLAGPALTTLKRILDATEQDLQQVTDLVKAQTALDLQRLFDLAAETANSALVSQFPRYVFEAGLAKMATLESLRPLPEILKILQEGGGGGGGAARPQAKGARPSAAAPAAPVAAAPVMRSATFNPSWQDFVNYVKTCSELVLSAFLRRVVAKQFGDGVLHIEGARFDLNSLREGATLASLKRCLVNYSQHPEWHITFSEVEAVPQGADAPAAEASGTAQVLPESLAAMEQRAKRERQEQIDSEARSHPAVKAALSTFGGKIDKVSILKE